MRIVLGSFVSVRITDKGWPDLPAVPETEAPALPEGHLDHLVNFLIEVGFARAILKYHTRFLDFDSEVMRAVYNRNRGLNDNRPILNKDEWDLLMDYCAHGRKLFT